VVVVVVVAVLLLLLLVVGHSQRGQHTARETRLAHEDEAGNKA
jgi:hypothetical protein